jgi:hypothetical protein
MILEGAFNGNCQERSSPLKKSPPGRSVVPDRVQIVRIAATSTISPSVVITSQSVRWPPGNDAEVQADYRQEYR